MQQGHYKLVCSNCMRAFGTIVCDDKNTLDDTALRLTTQGARLNCESCSDQLFSEPPEFDYDEDTDAGTPFEPDYETYEKNELAQEMAREQ